MVITISSCQVSASPSQVSIRFLADDDSILSELRFSEKFARSITEPTEAEPGATAQQESLRWKARLVAALQSDANFTLIERDFEMILEKLKGGYIYGVPADVDDVKVLVVAAYHAGRQESDIAR